VTVPVVTVEFLGMARHRAGRSELSAAGRTVAELLVAVVRACPKLGGLFTESGAVSRQFLISIDGQRFTDDPNEVIPTGCRLLIFGADAGG
jgi:molybdopterin converting factor small subunit